MPSHGLDKSVLRGIGWNSEAIWVWENKQKLKEKIRACQLWRTRDYSTEEVTVKPLNLEPVRTWSRNNKKPRKRDAVWLKEDSAELFGEIVKIIWNDGEADTVICSFGDNTKWIDGIHFQNHIERLGRTRWLIEL